MYIVLQPLETNSENCGLCRQVGLTSDEQVKVLDYHNILRSLVASGYITGGKPGPQPPATGQGILPLVFISKHYLLNI